VISPALTFAEHFWHSMPLFRQKLHSSVFIVDCSFPQLGWVGRDVAVVGLSLEDYFYGADVHGLSILFSGLELVCSDVYFFDFYVG